MPQIVVCPLSKLPETVEASGAQSVLTLVGEGVTVTRPAAVAPSRHLFVRVSDIVVAQDGHILPGEAHLERVLAFVRAWDRENPLVIHCWAGVSRSTAAAFIAACALDETRGETEIAQVIRARSPTATPNALMVEVADRMLGRDGRMIRAVAAIGRGAECCEGVPFAIDVDGRCQ